MGRRLLRGFVILAILYGTLGFLTSRLQWVKGVEGPDGSVTGPITTTGHVASGVISIHTEHSHDATGSIDDVVRAARATQLGFALIGDHPPAREPWLQAEYRDSVLIGYGIELVLPDAGRGLFFGMTTPPDHALFATEGFMGLFDDPQMTGVVIHGRGPRERERWFLEETGPMHAWEVMDVSESARRALANPWSVYHAASLVLSGLTGTTGQSLLRMDRLGFRAPSVAAYDSMSMQSPLTALAGLNHHPKTVWRGGPLPDYLPFFETLINHILLPTPLTGSAEDDLRSIGDAIRRGEAFVSLGRTPSGEEFRLALVDDAGRLTPMGGSAELSPNQWLVTSALDANGGTPLFRVIRDGEEIAWRRGTFLHYPIYDPGIYRVEVYRYAFHAGPLHFDFRPWIFSNTIRIEPDRTTLRDSDSPAAPQEPAEVI